MYNVKINQITFDNKVYPPAIDVSLVINHDSDVLAPMMLRYVLVFNSGENTFQFIEGLTPPKGALSKQVRLALDYHSFRHLAEKNEQADGVRIVVYVHLLSGSGYVLAHSDFTLCLAEIIGF